MCDCEPECSGQLRIFEDSILKTLRCDYCGDVVKELGSEPYAPDPRDSPGTPNPPAASE